MTDTIFALSTPPGRSAIAVVRMSGPSSSKALLALTSPLPPARRASLRNLRDPKTGDLLDSALVLYLPGPKSETGEDIVELHLHGGKAVISGVLQSLMNQPGLRPAEPGEFARRALDNGRMDLAQVEGLADLIEAETEAQRVQAMRGASGAASALYDGWRRDVIAILALVSAAIDFSDEADVSIATVRQAEEKAQDLALKLASALADGNRGEILRDGFRVVLAGAPNAGKSSLLNALARREAAIVSEEAGTTRDIVEVRLEIGGWPVIVSDTAGLRQTTSQVESEGIRRTLAATREADLVLWLVAPDGPAGAPDEVTSNDTQVIEIITKSDLLTNDDLIHVKQSASENHAPPQISTVTGDGLVSLTAMLLDRAMAATGRPGEAVITRARHRREVETAHRFVRAFLEDTEQEIELRCESLRLAASAISRLTGHIGTEEILGEIFGRFCIGK